MTDTVRRRYKPGEFELAVKRSSAGLGLFAASPIPKGACVIEYIGRQISREEMYTSNSNKARYINHSCRPNCEIEIAKGRVWIFARRNIKVGEELGYDYGEAYVNEYLAGKCLCAKCAPKKAAA